MFDLFWLNGLLTVGGARMPNETCLDSLKVLALLPWALGVLVGCSVFGFLFLFLAGSLHVIFEAF